MNINQSSIQRYISEFEGYNVKFSPFENNKLAACFSQYYGIIGNGRLSVFLINNLGIIEETVRFNSNDAMFDIAWSELNENQLVSVGGDGSVNFYIIS
jgi:peroxin-7